MARHLRRNPLFRLATGPDASEPRGSSRRQSRRGTLHLGFKTYPQTLQLGDHELVLTFDDGPWPKTTPAVLNALRDECVAATFFLIGRNAAANPGLVQREEREFHTVGTHSNTHPAVTLRGLNVASGTADIEAGIKAVETAGYGSAAFPPAIRMSRFSGSPALRIRRPC